MSEQTEPTLHLHTYFRSSCSSRVRTACNLKGISLSYTYIPLLTSAQNSPTYTVLNPSASVPTLTVSFPSSSSQPIIIRQSIAILEFLEEFFPSSRPLLPPPTDITSRARVRELVNIIANDVQPVTNLRVLKKVRQMGGEEAGKEWARDFMERGLRAYDRVAEGGSGRFSVGDEVTMADVCLAPAVEGALRYGVDVQGLSTIWRVYNEIKGMEAFARGDWRHQEDTPVDFRVVD